MAKSEVAAKGKADAAIVVNNSFIEGLIKQLSEKEKFGLTFPADYNYRNELLGAYLVLKETADRDGKCVLESCSQVSIAQTLMDMVTLGLSIQKKQCYPIAYRGQLQCQVSVFGNTCIARRYGMKTINAMCIYEGDVFQYHIEDARIVVDKHTQDFMSLGSGKILGAYAVITMDDGTKYTEVMNMDMIKQAWKQGFGYKESGGTHQKFADQMAMKTVKNRALKYIIRTYGTQMTDDAYDRSEEAETADKVVESKQYDVQTKANKIPFQPSYEVPAPAMTISNEEVAALLSPEIEASVDADTVEEDLTPDGEQIELEIPFAA